MVLGAAARRAGPGRAEPNRTEPNRTAAPRLCAIPGRERNRFSPGWLGTPAKFWCTLPLILGGRGWRSRSPFPGSKWDIPAHLTVLL